MPTRIGRTAITTLLLWGGLALIGAPALAAGPRTAVQCGDVLTHSVRVANDLTDCPGDGLVVGAPGITVDLDGHTIDGSVSQAADCEADRRNDAGIQNDAGYDGVTITNGTVQQFSKGIAAGEVAAGMSHGRVGDVTVRDNRLVGIVLVGAQAPGAANEGNRVIHNVVSGTVCGSAMYLLAAHANRVAANRVKDNLESIAVCCDGNTVVANSVSGGFSGVLLFNSSHNLVARNTVADSDVGIDAVGSAADNRIEHNGIARTQAGIVLESSEFSSGSPAGNRVAGNTLASVADGIIVFEAEDTGVTGNVVSAAGSFGDPDTGGFGIVLDGASHGVVDRNTVVGARGPGISVGVEGDGGSDLPPIGNTVARNTVAHGAVDGIVVLAAARDTTVERNAAYRNGADGISVLSPFTTVARNEADRNAAYGIEAVQGVTDGGGNRARGNGNPAQCAGVVCAAGRG